MVWSGWEVGKECAEKMKNELQPGYWVAGQPIGTKSTIICPSCKTVAHSFEINETITINLQETCKHCGAMIVQQVLR